MNNEKITIEYDGSKSYKFTGMLHEVYSVDKHYSNSKMAISILDIDHDFENIAKIIVEVILPTNANISEYANLKDCDQSNLVAYNISKLFVKKKYRGIGIENALLNKLTTKYYKYLCKKHPTKNVVICAILGKMITRYNPNEIDKNTNEQIDHRDERYFKYLDSVGELFEKEGFKLVKDSTYLRYYVFDA